jgi:hypothetical protein
MRSFRPDNVAIGGKAPPPERITQQDSLVVAWLALFGQKGAPELGLDTEQREEGGRDQGRFYADRYSIGSDVEAGSVDRGDFGEAVVAAEVLELGGRNPVMVVGDANAGETHPELNQLAGIWIGQRLKNDSVHDTENGGVGANAQSQGEYRDQGETRSAAENAQGVADIFED